MKLFIRDNRLFLGLCTALCLVLGGLLLSIDKATLHLALNSYHASWLDTVMLLFSHEGIIDVVAIVLCLCFGRLGWTCFMGGAMAINGLLGQGVKHLVCAYRPEKWFMVHYPELQLPVVPGYKLAHFYSFPSGHTVIFFTIAFVASMMLPAKYKKVGVPIFFVLALIGAYSRIYISMHFTADILGGVVLAIGGTIGLYFATKKWHNTTFWKLRLWDLGKK